MTAGAPRLYIITDRRATAGRPLLDVVRAALAGAPPGTPPGALAVQLREKDLGGRELVALARELRVLTADAGAALYINDRVDVALAVGADGVHLGGGALGPDDVARVAPALAVALSTHAPAEAQAAALASQINVRFVVLGPIFDTPSKRRYGAPLGIAALRAATAATGAPSRKSPPVLALGGVTAARAAECLQAGAVGVACIGAVMAADRPGDAVKGFFRVFEGREPMSSP